MTSDRVGDFITRLTNAAGAGKFVVETPHSDHLEAIAKKLRELGYLEDVSVEGDTKKTLTVTLTRDARGAVRLQGVRRMSSPGRRLYVSRTEAHSVKNGSGARIISTPRGILSDKEARKEGVGGEDLFQIW